MTAHTIIGCGYVGKAVAQLWLSKNLQVQATTTHPEKVVILEDLGCIPFLLSTKKAFEDAIDNARCILLSVAPHKNASYASTYLETANRLLEAIQTKKSFPHIIYTSSTSVYGAYDDCIVTEETPLVPETEESRILAQTEKALLDYPYTTILRFGEIIGPNREPYRRLQNLQKEPLPGDGTSICNFTNLSDAVNAIELARTQQLYGIYNVVCSSHPTRRELYENLSKAMQLPPPEWDPTKKNRHGSRKTVSNQKLLQLQFAFSSPFGLK